MLLLDGPKPQTIEGREYQEGNLGLDGLWRIHCSVFDNETRELYDLERLWNDCPRIHWQES